MKKTALAASAALALGVLVLPASAADFDGVPHLLKDINPGATKSWIDGGAVTGSRVVFQATDAEHSPEPWVSDGTSAGTRLLKDIGPGQQESNPEDFTTFKGKVYFGAGGDADGEYVGRELWVTDGTTKGTHLVADLAPGALSSKPTELTVAGGRLYFTADSGAPGSPGGTELWAYTGSGSPVQVTAKPNYTGINHVTAFGSKVVFGTSFDGHGFEPWISDGTSAGTHQLGDVNPGAASSDPAEFTTLGSSVLFSATRAGVGTELWRSDGTDDSVTLVTNLDGGATSTNPHDLYRVGDRVVFNAKTAGAGEVLWSTDGTGDAGTVKLADVRGGGTDDNSAGWTLYKGWVYFSGEPKNGNAQLWRTKGLPGQTALFASISASGNASPQGFRVVDGSLYFSADTNEKGTELWRTDGTVSGTKLVKDVNPGAGSSNPDAVGVVANTLIFSAAGSAGNKELWAFTTRSSTTKGSARTVSAASDARKNVYVTVKVSAAGTTPTGRVTLKKGTRTIGYRNLSGGAARIHVTKKLGKGTHRLQAFYAGSVQARTSYSSTFKLTVR